MSSWELPSIKADSNPMFVSFLVLMRSLTLLVLAESNQLGFVSIEEWVLFLNQGVQFLRVIFEALAMNYSGSLF